MDKKTLHKLLENIQKLSMLFILVTNKNQSNEDKPRIIGLPWRYIYIWGSSVTLCHLCVKACQVWLLNDAS